MSVGEGNRRKSATAALRASVLDAASQLGTRDLLSRFSDANPVPKQSRWTVGNGLLGLIQPVRQADREQLGTDMCLDLRSVIPLVDDGSRKRLGKRRDGR